MLHSLSAQIVVDVSLDTDKGKVNYTVTNHEGDCNGINQLAESLTKQILASLPQCTKPQGVEECHK